MCVPLLWALGQSGKTDLSVGVKGKRNNSPLSQIIYCVGILGMIKVLEPQVQMSHLQPNILLATFHEFSSKQTVEIVH